MSQDFRAAFGLGTDDKTITEVDVNGVALAAIQGLNAKLEAKLAERDAEVAVLKVELAAICSTLATIGARRSTQTAEIAP